MSLQANELFLQRVADFIDNVEGMGYIPRHAAQLLENQEYEELEKFLVRVETELAQSEFHGSGFFSEQTDVA